MMQNKYLKRVALKRRVAQIIDRSYFVRFHMFIILMATTLSGLLFSKLLIVLGLENMAIRFGFAIIISYMMFFLFIKLWLLYIGAGNIFKIQKTKSTNNSSLLDLVPSTDNILTSTGDTNHFTGFGGGTSGGGGAGRSFITEGESLLGNTHSESDFVEGIGNVAGEMTDDVLGDEGGIGLIAIVLLAVLVFSAVIASGYLIWCAPSIMSEAAFQLFLVTTFASKVQHNEETGWKMSIFQSTCWIFLVFLIFSVFFGYFAQKFIPSAITVRDIFYNIR